MKVFPAVLIILFFYGCSSSRITTAWKTPQPGAVQHERILVVAVINDEKGAQRKEVEKRFTAILNARGYKALSAVETFGPAGLSNLGEAATYQKLCSNEIDAVMTVALIDVNKESRQKTRRSYGYPSNYYYNRIWHYRDMEAGPETETRCFWESILFSLNTLEAECTVQTRAFNNAKEGKMTRDVENQVIGKMTKEKILVKKLTVKKKLKAF